MKANRKKLMKAAAFLAAAGILCGLLYFADAMVGNPISRLLVTRSARQYMEETYPNRDFVMGDVNYSFKDGNYWVRISSPNSPDSAFSLEYQCWGKLRLDTYEDMVLSGENTFRRLDDAYRARWDDVVASPAFPYPSDISYGTLWDAVVFPYDEPHPEEAAPGEKPYPLYTKDLILDGVYDVGQLGARHGTGCLYVETQEVTPEMAAQVLLDLKDVMEKNSLPFFCVDLVLEHPRGADGQRSSLPSLDLTNFPWSQIYAEELIDRVQENMQETKAYHSAKSKE